MAIVNERKTVQNSTRQEGIRTLPDNYIIGLMVQAARHLSKNNRQVYRKELQNNPEKVEAYRQALIEKRKIKA